MHNEQDYEPSEFDHDIPKGWAERRLFKKGDLVKPSIGVLDSRFENDIGTVLDDETTDSALLKIKWGNKINPYFTCHSWQLTLHVAVVEVK